MLTSQWLLGMSIYYLVFVLTLRHEKKEELFKDYSKKKYYFYQKNRWRKVWEMVIVTFLAQINEVDILIYKEVKVSKTQRGIETKR